MMKESNWTGAGHAALPQIWGSVEKFIIEALEQNGYYKVDSGHYWDLIQKEEMQLWVLFNDTDGITGILITHVYIFMQQKICNIPICGGGSIEEWEEFMTTVIEPWALEQNCNRIEFRTRKASAKILARHKYYVSDITLTKRLTCEEH